MAIDAVSAARDNFSQSHLDNPEWHLSEEQISNNLPENQSRRHTFTPIELGQALQAASTKAPAKIDFESIDKEMAKILIDYQHTRSKINFTQAEVCRAVWLANVHVHAAQFSGSKWNIWLFPALKTGLDIAQVGTVVALGANMKRAEPILKMCGLAQSISEAWKEYFATVDRGVQVECQAQSELSKILFEQSERNGQTFEQQLIEALKKLEEGRRRREDMEQAMARA